MFVLRVLLSALRLRAAAATAPVAVVAGRARAPWLIWPLGLLWLQGCRIEPVQDLEGGLAPEQTAPASKTVPLAWSRDVAVLAAVEPAQHSDAMQRAVRQLSRTLCERLTLQSDVEAAWHAAVVRLERELTTDGYFARDALLSSSDGRWGASALTEATLSKHKGGQALLMETAWQFWERGSGLQLVPETAATPTDLHVLDAVKPSQVSPTALSVPAPAPAPTIEDPSRNWVSVLPVAPEPPSSVVSSAAPSGPSPAEAVEGPPSGQHPPGELSSIADDDAGVVDAEPEVAPRSVAVEASRSLPQVVHVALLVRLSDGSFRGTWLRVTRDSAKLDAVVRDVVVGERLYVGALGAVFALDVPDQFQEPSAASRAYERLLQPGTGKAPATLVLTSATLEPDTRPGTFALSSRGAEAGKCRLVFQESAL